MTRYSCMYTHQKQKKRKVWQDGALVQEKQTLRLLNSTGRVLDKFMLSSDQEDVSGKEFEFERHLIIEISKEGATQAAAEQQPVARPVARPRRRAGLRGRGQTFKPPSSVSVDSRESSIPREQPIPPRPDFTPAPQPAAATTYKRPLPEPQPFESSIRQVQPIAAATMPAQLFSSAVLSCLRNGSSALPTLPSSMQSAPSQSRHAPGRLDSVQSPTALASVASVPKASTVPSSRAQTVSSSAVSRPGSSASSSSSHMASASSSSSHMASASSSSHMASASSSSHMASSHKASSSSSWDILRFPPPWALPGLSASARSDTKRPEAFWLPVPGTPVRPDGVMSYVRAQSRVLNHTVTSDMAPIAKAYWTALASTIPAAAASAGLRASSQTAAAASVGGISDASLTRLQAEARRAGCPCYGRMRLIRLPAKREGSQAKSGKSAAKRSKKRDGGALRHSHHDDDGSNDGGGDDDDNSGCGMAGAAVAAAHGITPQKRFRLFLELPDRSMERSSAYSLGDLWLVSTTPTMMDGAPQAMCIPAGGARPGRGGGTNSGPTAARSGTWFFARSLFHGPSQKRWIEIEPVPVTMAEASMWPPPVRSMWSKAAAAITQHSHSNHPLPTEAVAAAAAAGGGGVTLSALPSVLAEWPGIGGGMGPTAGLAVCGIRLGDCCDGTTFAVADALSTLGTVYATSPASSAIAPIVSRVLAAPGPTALPAQLGLPIVDRDSCVAAVDSVAGLFQLNSAQKEILQQTASWFQPPQSLKASEGRSSSAAGEAVLVHGAFGSGKSTLVAALLHLIQSLSPTSVTVGARRPVRVLFAANTNTAVDGVLLKLLDRGFDDFVRLGSVRRIAPRVLPHILEPDLTPEARKRLQLELHQVRESLIPAGSASGSRGIASVERHQQDQDLEAVDSTLAALAHGSRASVARQRMHASLVVAVTSAASCFPAMKGQRFDIVILDECSQMVEATSLLTLARFGAHKLIAVGDPKQLPPTLPGSVLGPSGQANRTTAGCVPADVTVFERLASTSVATVSPMLTQYRCHPAIAAAASRLFYAGKIRSGVSPKQRRSILSPLGPIAFLDTSMACIATSGRPRCAERAGRSPSNAGEAAVCAELVVHLITRCAIDPDRIGVICLYRAQKAAIEDAIATQCHHIRSRASVAISPPSSSSSSSSAGEADGERSSASSVEALSRAQKALRDAQEQLAVEQARNLSAVMVSTVDAFQGAERDIIIVATTRAQGSSSGRGSATAFLDDPRRANVAMTRAKHHLIVLAVPALLKTTKYWAPLVDIAMAVSKDGWTLLPPARVNTPWSVSRRSNPEDSAPSQAAASNSSSSSSTLASPYTHENEALGADSSTPQDQDEAEYEGLEEARGGKEYDDVSQQPASSDPWSGGDEEFL